MFLNLSPPFTDAPSVLIDQNVNYYGFLESKEHDNWMKSIEGQMLTSVIYESPYFGTMPSGAYRELDKVYEAYKVRIKAQDVYINPIEIEILYNCGDDYFYSGTLKKCVPYPEPTSTISPALILAAAAAFFFAG